MVENKKKTRRPKIKDDFADLKVTIRMRKSHFSKFMGLPSNDSIGKFVGDLVEGFFENREYRQKIPLLHDPEWALNFNDYIASAGNKIDTDEAHKCLIAWLDGSPLPPFTRSVELDDLYNYIMLVRDDYYEYAGDVTEAGLMEVSVKVLDLVRDMYFEYKSIHLNVFKMLSKVLKTPDQAILDPSQIIEQINELLNLEYVIIYHHCMSSPSLRFSIYECWRHGKLKKRAKRPKWFRFAGDDLFAMNQPISNEAS